MQKTQQKPKQKKRMLAAGKIVKGQTTIKTKSGKLTFNVN